MSEVEDVIQGLPTQPDHQAQKNEPTGSKKFHETMQQIQSASESDAEEQKKGKHRGEESTQLLEQLHALPTAPSEAAQPSPYAISPTQGGMRALSGTAVMGEVPIARWNPSPISFGQEWQVAESKQPPLQILTAATPYEGAPPPQAKAKEMLPLPTPIELAKQPPAPAPKTEVAPTKPPPPLAIPIAAPTTETLPTQPLVTTPPKEPQPLPMEPGATIPIQKEGVPEVLVAPPSPPTPFAMPVVPPKEKAGELGGVTLSAAMGPMAGMLPAEIASSTPTLLAHAKSSPIVHFSPHVWELFQKMVGSMLYMQEQSINQTTLTLDTPNYANSIFFGMQIIIQEFSFAPLSYNIEFKGSPQAIAVLQGNLEVLLAAFRTGNYSFSINRIDLSHLERLPVEGAAEKESGDEETP